MKVLNQWAVVTGASTGLGYGYCQQLLKKGYHIFGISRNAQNLLSLQKEYPHLKIMAHNMDLSIRDNAYKLFELTENLNVTLIINNAGFGVLGKFQDTDLNSELNMLDLNLDTLHILTKLYLQRFLKNDYGRVINIASCAAFVPGPGFSSYYASKAYVLNLSSAINYELIAQKKQVRVITICPGPIKTNFWQRAKGIKAPKNYKSGIPSMDLDVFVAKSLTKALTTKRKNYILIGFWNRCMILLFKILPKRLSLRILYKYQVSR